MRAETVLVGDAAVDAIERDGGVWVVVRRVCEALGLDVVTQRQRLLTAGWASGKAIMVQVEDALGRPRETLVIALDALPMWLASIDGARVSEPARPRLARFQAEARDVLARHFRLDGVAHPTPPVASGSGGGAGSGARTAMSAVHGSGSVLDLLAITDNLSGAIRATFMEVQAVRAVAEQAHAAIDETKHLADTARVVAGNASALADDAQTVARLALDEAKRAGSKGIPVARRRAAVGHITRAVRTFCATHSIGYQVVYAQLRRDLGLPRKQDGGPALGNADLRADQIIRLARSANNMGVPDCGAHVIESILSGGVTPPPTITMTPSSPARTADVVDSMLDFVTAKPTGPVQ